MFEKGPEPAWYLIAVAVGWYALSLIFAGIFGFLLFQTSHGVVQSLITTAAGLVILLIAATIRACKVGQGSIRLGLGDQPVSNRFYVAVLAVMIAVYAVMLQTARHHIYPDSASPLILLNPWQSLLRLSVIVGLAQASEELFFRGWLWTGLRKHWSFVPTAAATSAHWLAIHLDRPSLSILPVHRSCWYP